MERVDVLVVGGGLQAGLLGLAFAARRPDVNVLILERGPRLGGNHTWCFHEADVPPAAWPVVEGLVVQSWPGYEVRFPGHRRQLASAYAMTTSARLHDHVSRTLVGAVVPEVDVIALDATSAVAADGRRFHASLVVDARGPRLDPDSHAGYQKFVGLELRTTVPHGIELPVVMDACVPQADGYRFVYVLPLGPRELLVEDTYFADDPGLDRELLCERIHEWVTAAGLTVAEILREEQGVLPLPWRGVAPAPEPGSPLPAGYGGGWFHPVTGYSFPVALRLALAVAEAGPHADLPAALAGMRRAHAGQVRFAHLLNRMLFRLYPPADRWRVLERFYRLPAPTIARFYALETTAADRMRILCGRPPAGLSLAGWREARQ